MNMDALSSQEREKLLKASELIGAVLGNRHDTDAELQKWKQLYFDSQKELDILKRERQAQNGSHTNGTPAGPASSKDPPNKTRPSQSNLSRNSSGRSLSNGARSPQPPTWYTPMSVSRFGPVHGIGIPLAPLRRTAGGSMIHGTGPLTSSPPGGPGESPSHLSPFGPDLRHRMLGPSFSESSAASSPSSGGGVGGSPSRGIGLRTAPNTLPIPVPVAEGAAYSFPPAPIQTEEDEGEVGDVEDELEKELRGMGARGGAGSARGLASARSGISFRTHGAAFVEDGDFSGRGAKGGAEVAPAAAAAAAQAAAADDLAPEPGPPSPRAARQRRGSTLSGNGDSSPSPSEPSISMEAGAFCVIPSKSGDCSVTMDDEGTMGIGVAAATALAIAAARAWAGFARESAQRLQLQQPRALPSRTAYRLVASLASCPDEPGGGWPDDDTPSATPRSTMAGEGWGQGQGAGGRTAVRRPSSGTGSADIPRPRGSHLSLQWVEDPKTVLVVSKPTQEVMEHTLKVVEFLRDRGLCVFVEPRAHAELMRMGRKRLPGLAEGSEAGGEGGASSVLGAPAEVKGLYAVLRRDSIGMTRESVLSPTIFDGESLHPPLGSCPTGPARRGRLLTWREDGGLRTLHEITDHLDLVVTLGGDGTVLYTCSLFNNRVVPPVVAFALGSLGFMAPFEFAAHEEVLQRVLAGDFTLNIRHRLHCRIRRTGREDEAGGGGGPPPLEDHVVLNEVVFDRGMSPFLTKLECYADGSFVTLVQGDGLIIATPTGSTAYSLSAGGCMVHPQVPALLMTPICAHSLSFRPMIFPEHIRMSIQIPKDSRATTWCSFDGKERQQLSGGDAVFIRVSRFPVPMVARQDATHDFFLSLREGLSWNQRITQGQNEKPAHN